MTMNEQTYYLSYFIDELFQNGMEDVVISPGSRSTPLAMLFSEHPHLNDWLHFDERSAAFFALGIAQTKQKPVALICTSGTAAANYYPAIIEAYYSRVPLIILTADRPHELRDNGAPQAIDQIKMYGDYVKHYHEMALPEATEPMLGYSRRLASRAYTIANSRNKGVVQYNFPFRDPLIPDLLLKDLWGQFKSPYLKSSGGFETIDDFEAEDILQAVSNYNRGLIVCGELTREEEITSVLKLAKEWKIPVLADSLSQLRQYEETHEYVISTYDALLKHDDFRENYQPEFIIRFGSMPVSKPYFQWLMSYEPNLHIVVDEQAGYREPSNARTWMVYSSVDHFIDQLLSSNSSYVCDQKWTREWLSIDEETKTMLRRITEHELTEGSVVSTLSDHLPNRHTVFVGSSMPIRDMDTFFLPAKKHVTVRANRGANGIDGVVSSAFGAAATGEEVTLLIGDLSFLHDYTSLLLGIKNELNLRIVVINNNGGGIFSFLPQYEHKKHFEKLFGTPFNPPIKEMVGSLGVRYHFAQSNEQLARLVRKPVTGIEVVEVQTDRDENFKWHQDIRGHVRQIINDYKGER
ncbi:2-succinyl-5-enolpyruvyl-6-hydroxy-3-cyclohexene-1-carboxylate synthase [Alkalibacillus filiformis]|uniref:2-succinyl-5-enolpyruvyl-6-hydroxy-3-cyclohexene-1-carboxylate synthase n=1 Tax=Alkalibacillus filiformis TaxID=200990 RepID=A0ABU0DWT4_9BACI|nr:2-succinyl-5-enolpyruvyl-6-hydroxy-3-cyclohexene-1-carboxylic-acid synthase [Alkalibacillus filiformis]MDQ0352937.1 2-succinyl-5-enolpyruvyl-6-hydroxy-3-cyclohexene-1-carboxylate synthase [Alkalibacillus filiformis]